MLNIRNLSTQQFLILAVGSAILLRLVLMPFFSHVDIFSEYRRIFYALDNEVFGNAHRVVVFYIEMIFASISKLFIPSSETTFYLADPSNSTASLRDYYFFIEDKYIYRYLFFFKLPYLLFDLAVAAVIWRFIDDPINKRIALLLWLFNPIILFATYIFGRFEVIGIFFLAMTALQLKQHKMVMASIYFAIALLSREINLIFIPFFLIALIDFKDHPIRNIVVVGFCTTLITVIYLAPSWIIPEIGNINLFVNPDQTHQSDMLDKLFSFGYHWFYPIIFGLAMRAIYTWELGKSEHAERFVVACALCMFIYFGFNVHSVHYAAWLIIFPILSMQYNYKVVLPFLILFLAWTALWLLKTDAGVFTPFLAAPLSSDFIGIGHFPTFFNESIATPELTLHKAVQIMRTLFLVTMAFFFYRLIKR